MSAMMVGPPDFAIMSSEIAAFGQTCQVTDASPICVPIGTSCAATSTSSVSIFAAACTIGAGGVGPPLLNKK